MKNFLRRIFRGADAERISDEQRLFDQVDLYISAMLQLLNNPYHLSKVERRSVIEMSVVLEGVKRSILQNKADLQHCLSVCGDADRLFKLLRGS